MTRKKPATRSTRSKPTIYVCRLRSSKGSNACKCKVGACPICNSRCKRCMCSCYGIEPTEALQQSRGGYRRQVNSLLLAQKNEKAKSKDVNTRSMTRKGNKRRYNPHFHKVGLQEKVQTKAKQKNAKKKKTNEQKLSSDSSFHLSDDDETIIDDTTACPSVVAIPEFK